MCQSPPPPPFPPTPYPYYPPASVRLGFWGLRRLVKSLPPPQSYSAWQYKQLLLTENQARKRRLFFSLIPR